MPYSDTITAPAAEVVIRLDLGKVNDTEAVVVTLPGFLGPGLFPKFVDAMRNGGRFHGETRTNWCVLQDVPRVVNSLKSAGFQVTGTRALRDAMDRLGRTAQAEEEAAAARAEDLDRMLTATGKSLYGYQRIGVRTLASAEGFNLWDDMGVGKTVQALAALPKMGRAVVVAPVNAKGVWKREIKMWRSDLRPTVLTGRGSFHWPEPGEVIITSYQILPELEDLQTAPAGTVLIFDEAQNVRNYKSQQSKRSQAMADTVRKSSGKVWVLTATPVDNRPFELWTLMQLSGTAYRAFGSWKNFLELHQAYRGRNGWSFGRPTVSGVPVFDRAEEIAECVRRVSLRRTKKEVLTEIPAKQYRTVYAEISSAVAKKCDAIMTKIGLNGIETMTMEEIAEKINAAKSNPSSIQALSSLRALLAAAKVPALMEEVEAHELAGEPLIVFSSHRGPVDALAGRDGWAIIHGEVSGEERARIQDDFQAGKLKGVAGTIRAMGTAMTLTRSASVIFAGMEMTPGWNSQAEDRACRIGQNRPVTITTLAADHPLDYRLEEILLRKAALVEASVNSSARSASENVDTTADALREFVK